MREFGSLLFLMVFAIVSFAQQEHKHAVVLQANSIPERNTNGYNPFGDYWNETKDLYEGPNIRVHDRSFSAGIMYYNYRKENMMMRARAGVIRTAIRSNWTFTDATFRHNYEAEKSQLGFYFAPGVAKMFNMMRFAYFAGVEMPVTMYGTSQVRKNYSYSMLNSGELKYNYVTNGSYRDGWSAGLGAFGGFSVKFHRNLTFGPELGFAFIYSDHGSKGEFESITENGATHTEHLSFSRSYRKFGVSGVQGSLNLSYWF